MKKPWCLLDVGLFSTALLAAPYITQFTPCPEPPDMGYCLQVWIQNDQHYHLTLPLEGDPYSWQWPELRNWQWTPQLEQPLATLLPWFLQQHCTGQPIFQCLDILLAERHWHELLTFLPGRRLLQSGYQATESDNGAGWGGWFKRQYEQSGPWMIASGSLLLTAITLPIISCIGCYQIGKRWAGYTVDTSEGFATDDFQRPPQINYPTLRNRPFFDGEFFNKASLSRRSHPQLQSQFYGERGIATLERLGESVVITRERQTLEEGLEEAFQFLESEEIGYSK